MRHLFKSGIYSTHYLDLHDIHLRVTKIQGQCLIKEIQYYKLHQ